MPLLLPAPRLLSFTEYQPNIRDVYCYVLRHYGDTGITVLYCKNRDDVYVQIGDWAGNTLDLQRAEEPPVQLAHEFMERYSHLVFPLMSTIGLEQAQLFLNRELVLCDLQVAVNKLAGPGMIQNIFGNILATPEVLKIENIDQRTVEAIVAGTGTYSDNLILKPSRFRHLEVQTNRFTPLYVQVVR